MADYTRPPQRFFSKGLALFPADGMPEGYFPYLRNIRSYEEGTLGPRYGRNQLTTAAAMNGQIRTIARVNDTTPSATIPARRFVGTSNGLLYSAAPSATSYGAALDTGYSSDPLSTVVAVPQTSPQPWLYIGDRTKQRKANVNAVIYPIGTAAPINPPTLELGAPGVVVIDDFNAAASWAAVGGIAGAPSNVTPINTTISAIVYDGGSIGYASIGATSMANITLGKRVEINAAEFVLITDLLVAIASTTIGAILYDSGSTGLCSIQPAASLGTGQLEGPAYQDYISPFTPTLMPRIDTELHRIRQIDFPVRCLVRINSGGGSDEVVQILSVAIGKDGVQSFRCTTTNTHAAGETLTGIAGFRAYTVGTRAVGNTIVGAAVQQVITPTSVAPVVAGLQQTGLTLNLAQIAGRATEPEDDLALAFKADLLTAVSEIRLYLDVNNGTTNFLENYYMYVWRANDLIAAIQSVNAATTATLQDARQNVVLQSQIDQALLTQAAPTPEYTTDEEGNTIFNPDAGANVWGPTAPPTMTSGAPTSAAAVTRQLALGNNAWITLRAEIRDLIRVGTDQSRTLANVAGVQVLVQFAGVAAAITCQFDSALISGGYGPDVGDTGLPYNYCYRYRSTLTGARSAPSPPTRSGIVPRRQRVNVTPAAPADTQADLVDYFRYGGQLTRWTYVGSSPTSSGLADDAKDASIDGSETLRFDIFQPWPVADLPRSGLATVVGTSIQRTSGDLFNTAWAPGSAITVNGRTTMLYAQPSSTSRLTVVDSVGSGTNLAWSIRDPLLVSQPLPGLWGGPINNVLYLFACGATNDPGALYWTRGNDPESTSDKNWLTITSPTEPLQNGVIYDGAPFVASTDDLYRIVPTPGDVSDFRAVKTACGRGFWTRWAYCYGPEGIYFLAKDGIYFTAWGAPAISLTDPLLRTLFPHDGVNGVAFVEDTLLIDAPDMTATTSLRLSYVDGMLYFDYQGVTGGRYTLLYEIAAKRWLYDEYTPPVTVRAWEPGGSVHDQITGSVTGHLYDAAQTAVLDQSAPILFDVWTPLADGGDPRVVKSFGDVMIDLNPAQNAMGITCTPVTNTDTLHTPQVVGQGIGGRRQEAIELDNGDGVLGRNIGLRISGRLAAGDVDRPTFYLWEPSFVPKAEDVGRRATDWEDLGYLGAKFVQGVVIRADTYGEDKQILIEYDQQTAFTITINHDGEETIAYPLSPAGWTPFVGELVRLRGGDTRVWHLVDVRWVFEPAPEAATEWHTQPTPHDLPGYQSIRDLVVAHQSDDDITLTIVYDDGPTHVYTIPRSHNIYVRDYIVARAGKGRAVRSYTLKCAEPFRLFKRDMSVRVQGWGLPGGYLIAYPFGGPSRADGAAI